MTNPYIPLGPPGDTTNRTPKMLTGYRSKPVVNGDPPPPTGTSFAPDVDVTIVDSRSVITLTAQPSGAKEYWTPSVWFDTRGFNQMRAVLANVEAAGASTSRVRARYKTTVGGSFANPGVGGAEIAASMATVGPVKSGWVALDPAAIGDILLHADAIGGNGAASPAVGGIHFQFRLATTPDPCGGSGCPMPAGIYNGEDFSSYADEADFLNTAENGLKNFYSVWYGADGSVEGASFDPTLLFCNNPVVVGRWKAVSSGSNIWDIVGYGSTTRFANPLLDNGGSGGGQLVRFRSVWTTIRFKIESGWTSDGGVGFLISELFDAGNGINGSCRVYIKAGRIVVITQADSSAALQTTDIGPASMIVGTSGFMEVTTHATVTDQGGGIWRVMFEVFVNPACSGGPAGAINTATPLDTYTADVVPIPIGGVVNNLGFYDWDKFNYTSTPAQWPEKKIWVAQAFYSGSLT